MKLKDLPPVDVNRPPPQEPRGSRANLVRVQWFIATSELKRSAIWCQWFDALPLARRDTFVERLERGLQ